MSVRGNTHAGVIALAAVLLAGGQARAHHWSGIIEDEWLEDANGMRRHMSPSDPRNLLKSDSLWTRRPARWPEA